MGLALEPLKSPHDEHEQETKIILREGWFLKPQTRKHCDIKDDQHEENRAV